MNYSLPTIRLRKVVTKIGSGVTPAGGETAYVEKGVTFIRSQNVRESNLDLDDVAFITSTQHQMMGGSKVADLDVLLNITGASIGRSCVVPIGTGEANVNQHVCIIRPTDDLNPYFLSQFLNSHLGQEQIWSFQGGGSREGLNYVQIASFEIPSLPRKEQDSIASLLREWHSAIEKTERLIAAKQKRNESLSNRLLFGHARLRQRNTGATRALHWFSAPSDWQVVEIGKVAREVSALNSSDDGLPVLSCTKYDGLVDSLEYFDKQVFSHDTSKYKVVGRGQFAYATNHIEEGSIGYQDFVGAGLVSPIYTVFQSDAKKIDDGYFYKLLKTEKLRQIFSARTNSSVDRRGSLRWKDFARIHIPLPPLDEQREINAVLDDAKREIVLLQAQVEALKKQKRGLMQKLLTGQWRVKAAETEAG